MGRKKKREESKRGRERERTRWVVDMQTSREEHVCTRRPALMIYLLIYLPTYHIQNDVVIFLSL